MAILQKSIGRQLTQSKITKSTIGCILVVLSSCAGDVVRTSAVSTNVEIEDAVALPPADGPAVVGVIERRYSNAIAQDILLATNARTSGQNLLSVKVYGTSSVLKMGSGVLTSEAVTESKIAEEIRAALPGIVMRRSGNYVQNQFGPFGYATGSGIDGDACLYAWQQVRSKLGQVSPFANSGTIQVRLRLCQAGASAEQLLSFMYGYTLTAAVDSGSWNPYGEVAEPPSTLGQSAAPIYPQGSYVPATAVAPAVQPTQQPTFATDASSVSEPAAKVGGSTVSATSTGKHALAQTPSTDVPTRTPPGAALGPRVPSPSELAAPQQAISAGISGQTPPVAAHAVVPTPSCLARSQGGKADTCE